MKKHKQKAVRDEMVMIMSEAFQTVINQSLQVTGIKSKPVTENNSLNEGQYIINLKMYLDKEVKPWDFTPIIKLIQYESPAVLTKLLRQIHHDLAVLNIQEQTAALNRHTPSINDFSTDVPNELYILKALAEAIESVKSIVI